METPSTETFVPITDVAEHFSVSVSTVRTWVRNKRIPRDTFIKLGNTYRFQLSAVAKALTEANAEAAEVQKPNWVKEMAASNDNDDTSILDDL